MSNTDCSFSASLLPRQPQVTTGTRPAATATASRASSSRSAAVSSYSSLLRQTANSPVTPLAI